MRIAKMGTLYNFLAIYVTLWIHVTVGFRKCYGLTSNCTVVNAQLHKIDSCRIQCTFNRILHVNETLALSFENGTRIGYCTNMDYRVGSFKISFNDKTKTLILYIVDHIDVGFYRVSMCDTREMGLSIVSFQGD